MYSIHVILYSRPLSTCPLQTWVFAVKMLACNIDGLLMGPVQPGPSWVYMLLCDIDAGYGWKKEATKTYPSTKSATTHRPLSVRRGRESIQVWYSSSSNVGSCRSELRKLQWRVGLTICLHVFVKVLDCSIAGRRGALIDLRLAKGRTECHTKFWGSGKSVLILQELPTLIGVIGQLSMLIPSQCIHQVALWLLVSRMRGGQGWDMLPNLMLSVRVLYYWSLPIFFKVNHYWQTINLRQKHETWHTTEACCNTIRALMDIMPVLSLSRLKTCCKQTQSNDYSNNIYIC